MVLREWYNHSNAIKIYDQVNDLQQKYPDEPVSFGINVTMEAHTVGVETWKLFRLTGLYE